MLMVMYVKHVYCMKMKIAPQHADTTANALQVFLALSLGFHYLRDLTSKFLFNMQTYLLTLIYLFS